MFAQSSVYEKRILLTKPFQASQSWHQLSVYENMILNEWTLADVERRFIYQGVQIVVPPRSPASVPEPIGMPSDNILHWSEWLGFVVYYVNDWFIINFKPYQNKMHPFWNVLFWNLLRTEYVLFRMCSKQNVLKMKFAYKKISVLLKVWTMQSFLERKITIILKSLVK